MTWHEKPYSLLRTLARRNTRTQSNTAMPTSDTSEKRIQTSTEQRANTSLRQYSATTKSLLRKLDKLGREHARPSNRRQLLTAVALSLLLPEFFIPLFLYWRKKK